MKRYIELMNLLVNASEITVKDEVFGIRIESAHDIWTLFDLSSTSLKSRDGNFTLFLSELAFRTLNAARKELGWPLLGSEADRGEVQFRDSLIASGTIKDNQLTVDADSVNLFTISDCDGNTRLKIGTLKSDEQCELEQIRNILRLNPGEDAIIAVKALRIMADTLIKMTEGK